MMHLGNSTMACNRHYAGVGPGALVLKHVYGDHSELDHAHLTASNGWRAQREGQAVVWDQSTTEAYECSLVLMHREHASVGAG